jgi:hypothetical protein
VFFVCTLALALMASNGAGRGAQGGGESVLDRAPVTGTEPAPGQIPGALPATPGAAVPAPAVPAASAPGETAPAIPRQ